MNEDSVEDRRKSRRLVVEETVFVTFRPEFNKIGRLKDISRSGMAFEYPAYDNYGSTASVEVDIFSHIDDFHVSRVQCEVVYDIEGPAHPSFSDIQFRRCGLQFRALSDNNTAKLESFFDSYAALG